MDKPTTLTGCYGELHAPDSMVYLDENGRRVIEVFASETLPMPEDQKQILLSEIDAVIRKNFTVKQ